MDLALWNLANFLFASERRRCAVLCACIVIVGRLS